jgi:hypothetical protein
MMQPNNRVAAFEGHHIKSKMFLALTLTSIIPLLILTYTLHLHVVPLLDANTHWMLIGSLQGLLICTAHGWRWLCHLGCRSGGGAYSTAGR